MNYNRIAPVYYSIQKAVFGSAQEQIQMQLLPFMATGSILLVGPGNSFLPLKIIQQVQPALLVLIEPTPYFYSKIKQQLLGFEQVQLENMLFENFVVHPKKKPFNTIVLPFVIDSIETADWPNFYEKILQHSTITSSICISEFSSATSWKHKILEFVMHLFFRVFTGLKRKKYPEIESLFASNQFELINKQNQGIFTNWVFERKA